MSNKGRFVGDALTTDDDDRRSVTASTRNSQKQHHHHHQQQQQQQRQKQETTPPPQRLASDSRAVEPVVRPPNWAFVRHPPATGSVRLPGWSLPRWSLSAGRAVPRQPGRISTINATAHLVSSGIGCACPPDASPAAHLITSTSSKGRV